MPVRSHAPWLTQTDERLLELLAAEGALQRDAVQTRLAAVSPTLAVSDDTLDERCAVLLDHGLVTERDSGLALTAAGKGFLDGRVDLTADGPAFEAAGDPDATDPTNDYWTCPDCRWIGEHDDLDTDADGESVCPVCGNDWEFVE
ncbi:MAG: hypothetical protein ABEH83_03890 [Halobacterium sp.]